MKVSMPKAHRPRKCLQETTDMKKKLVIYGASGHGKVAADIARLRGYEEIIFCDDDPLKNEFQSSRVIHSLKEEDDYDLFIAIGDNKTRQVITERCGIKPVSLIHPGAVIASDCRIGDGVIVMANVVINSGSDIGDGAIINTCSSVDHDNIIGEYCHISVNAHTAGTVHLGRRVFVGIGANIVNNVSICDDVIIGASSAVIHNIEEKGTYVGIPAHKL